MRQNIQTVTLDDRDYLVDADFESGQRWSRDQPEVEDSMDIGGIWLEDGVTPAELSDEDIDRIEQILLKQRQVGLDAEGYDDFCSRFED